MAEFIHEPNDFFDFNRIYLKSPNLVSGGGFFTKFAVDGEALYIKTPKCKTKQGFVKSGKKIHCDLFFTNEEENAPFVRWMENLVAHTQRKIGEKRADWFQGNLTEEDIEDVTIHPIKSLRGGKIWTVRCGVSVKLGGGGGGGDDAPQIKVYDENQNEIDLEKINEDMEVITLLEICGVKCSLKSFQFEIEIKQMMVMKTYSILNACLLGGGGGAVAAAAAPPSKVCFDETIEIKQMEPPPPPHADDPIELLDYDENMEDMDEDDEGSLEEEKPPICINEEITDIGVESIEDFFGPPSPPPQAAEPHVDLDDFPPPPSPPPPPPAVESAADLGDIIKEIDVGETESGDDEPIKLKTPNELYYNMYSDAKRRAKEARQTAINAYLEAQNIKNLYNLDEMSEAESDDDLASMAQ